MTTKRLTPIEIDFVVQWFFYYMSLDQRERLMFEHPVLYNKLCDSEIMRVSQIRDEVKK